MFQVRAAYNGQIKVKASAKRVREFFGDVRNFVELMPGVESITNEAGGVWRWSVRADLPFISSMRTSFAVRRTRDEIELIEWSPAESEKKNLLRYAATFKEHDSQVLIGIEQRIELRRQHARDLHMLAGLIGEERISHEMQKSVHEMMRTFLERARTRLEK